DILAREIVAALLQDLHQQLGGAIAIDREDAFPVASRIITVHEGAPSLYAFVITPGRVSGLLERARRDDALCVLDARGAQDRVDRGRAHAKEVNGLPIKLCHLSD